MLVKKSLLILSFCILLMNVVSAQTAVSSNKLPINYIEAERLANMATEQLQQGEVKKADEAIRMSIKQYPTITVFNYVKELYKISDEYTANKIMDLLFESVYSFSTKNMLVLEPFASKYLEGKMVFQVMEYPLPNAQFLFGYAAFNINKEFGNYPSMIRILESVMKLDIKKSNTGFDFITMQMASFKWELPLAKQEYQKAFEAIEEIPISTYYTKDTKIMMLAYINFQKEDYKAALKYVDLMANPLQIYAMKFMIYAMLGNSEEAMKNYALNFQLRKESKIDHFITNDVFYYLSIIDLNNKDYQKALVNLDSTLNHRVQGMGSFATLVLIDRWKVYKTLGDAYTGLQQFEKARDCYNIALLSNSNYQPAANALVELETIIAIASSTDKTAPVITLIDPSPKRGLKVTTTSANVLIKGFAKDASEIKEVSINNKIIYSQKGGDFWGEVVLNEGINKISIDATDKIGNKASQVFEVERTIQKTIATNNTDNIIPIVEKIGKNICLLIGAQNYADANIPSLTNPVADAVRLKLILKNNYNFAEESIITLFNPSVNDVKRQLLELTTQLQPEDNLLIFYAGHGIWVEKEKKGYWLMTDAKRNDPNTWLPNKTVLDLIAKIPSRHTLLITDACFSGSVFKTRGLTDGAPKAIQEMEEKISRIAITSGNDTEVPDESVFMKYLIKALSENKEKYLTAQKMFINQIIEAVMTESKTEPRYGTLELAGHVGGDFIFIKK